ncbi:MAG: CRISPR-associated endonuclease Cas2 [Bacteroidales bacterium]|jgi:CRISPR-associated protein Cas2|nr:CRISPR-associated endonuclease Cas2 [Bacteroidales bacterium]
MLVISYDISNDKVRNKFSKLLTKNGAIRLQYSVYEVNNTFVVRENIKGVIAAFSTGNFDKGDSVMIFDIKDNNTIKYGNSIYRDKDIVYI